MNRRFTWLGRLWIFLSAFGAALSASGAVAAEPHVFWASEPVRPDDTVLVQGSDFATGTSVEMVRLDDAKTTAPGELPRVSAWTAAALLQASEQSLKFVVPAAWKAGVFAYRLKLGGTVSKPLLLNAPDPWWVQGNEGEAATPGGWLRVQGKSLAIGGASVVRLESEKGAAVLLPSEKADGFSARFAVPAGLAAGSYKVQVHNGCGGNAAWCAAGTVQIAPAPGTPANIFSVLDFYGPNAVQQMRKSLVKYTQPIDRTEGILAALKKAKEAGGGTVFFPAGRYTVKGALAIPPRTILRGEGMGVVTLWWGTGHFNLDGGGPQGRARIEEPKPPGVLISGPDFELRDLSLYLPLDYEQGIVAEKRLRMDHVRIRIDHYWLVQGRGGGAVARLGQNFAVTNCDILAKGDGLVPGRYGIIAHNKVSANKSNTPMGGAREVIVEDNEFVSMDPTTYQNISGVGRNLYYAHNHHESLYAQQADYSFTYDSGSGCYLGKIAEANGTKLLLAGDPTYPKWAQEKHTIWKRSAVCILDGRGAGQWREVVSNQGRAWEIERPFEVAPDETSVASIVSFNGRALVIGNHFEDANWVNAGYGMSIDVVYAENELFRCADLMNHGLRGEHGLQPSWFAQYLDNTIREGQTSIGSSSGNRETELYAGPITRWIVHRRHTLAADNSGSIGLNGNVSDVVVEGCKLQHPTNIIRIDEPARGVLLRNNQFEGSPRYEGGGVKSAVVVPADGVPAKELKK
jgi:hypothetical protein